MTEASQRTIPAGNQSFEEVFARASMRLRSTQALRTLPVLVISLLAVELGLKGRVPAAPLHLWESLIAGAWVGRAALCRAIVRKN